MTQRFQAGFLCTKSNPVANNRCDRRGQSINAMTEERNFNDDASKCENQPHDDSEFPTFLAWALTILKGFVTFIVLLFIVYPLLSRLLIWLGWGNAFPRIVRKARIRNNPAFVQYAFYIAIACIAAYPFLAVGNRIWRRLTRTRQAMKKSKKKNRIV